MKNMPPNSGYEGQLGPQDGPALPLPEEIICILKKESAYEVISLQQAGQDGKPDFKLSRFSYGSGSGDDSTTITQSLLDDFLIHGLPAHLQPSSRRRVHVLVSTHSGTGLGMRFYSAVLAPLLESLGLHDIAVPADEAKREVGEQQQGSYRLVVTQDADSVKNFAQQIGNQRRDARKEGVEHTVVLLSGDGGVVDMLNSIASTEDDDGTMSPSGESSKSNKVPLLALLPLGTGNALFNSLHKTVKTPPAASDLVQGLRTLLRGKAAPLPSFKAVFPEGSRTIAYSEASESASSTDKPAELEEHANSVAHLYGVVVASYGFHSQLVWESDTPAYRQHGAARFQMVAQELLKESHAYNATVQIATTTTIAANATGGTKQEGVVDLRTLDGDRHAYILATLVSNLEKTFCISPASQPLDGQLRLVHFGPVDGEKTMEIMMAAYDHGKHVGMRWAREGDEDEGVGYEDIEELRITTHEEDARWRKVCIDGTIVEIPRDGCMVVRREAKHHLRVLVDSSIGS